MIDHYSENEIANAQELLDAVDLPLPTLSDAELLALHGKILKKAGLMPQQKPRKKWKRALGLTAAFLFCAVGSGFAVLRVSDVFRAPLESTMMQATMGYGEKSAVAADAEGEAYSPSELYSENTVNDMGSLLSQSDTAAGVKITAQGVISDDNTLMVLMQADCEKNPDLLTGELSFENAQLTIEQTGITEYCNASFIENSAKGAQFLLHQQTQGGLIGSTVTLTLENLLAWQQSSGTDMALLHQNVWQTVQQLPKENINNMVTEYYTQEEIAYYEAEGIQLPKDDTGKAVMCRSLPPTDYAGIAFSENYPELRLTAAAVEANTLYIGIEGPVTRTSVAERLQTVGLKNLQSGEIVTAASIGMGSSQDSFSMEIAIEGINSLEDLKQYTFVADAGWILQTVAAGTWAFHFDLTMQNTTEQVETEQILQFTGGKLKIDKLEVSPISIAIDGHVLAGGTFTMPENQGVMLQNGTAIELYEVSSSYDHTTNAVQIRFFLPGVIERSSLKMLMLGENVIPLS
ncbi:MAG: DUF4179 domain-containing protein [Oscillospiraceae bacterium]|nr:DUF4179 domain-containing protein [Oscillospiraceae bacterium]